MIRVIVAEDEEKVCQLICHLIDWQALEMELVGTAQNGLEALELIAREKPDLVLTDIRMPGCSGLELLRRAHAANPQTEFIIISGYSHFEYAQTAIQYGVSDYILKPVNREQLDASLQKVCQRHRQRREEQAKVRHLRRSADLSSLREKLWRDLERGSLPGTVQACNEAYGCAFADGAYQLFCIGADFKKNEDISLPYAEYVLDQLRTKALLALKQQLAPLCRELVLADRGDWVTGLIHFDPAHQRAVRSAMSQVLSGLCVELHAFEKMQLHLSVSRQADHFSALPDCLVQAQLAMGQRLLLQDTLFLEEQPQEVAVNWDALYREFSAAVGRSLDLLSQEHLTEALQGLQKAVQDAGTGGSQSVSVVQRAYYLFLLSGALQSEAHLAGLEQRQAQFNRRATLCSSFEGLFQLLKDACLLELEALHERLNQEKVRPIAQAKTYIRDHYAEPLSLDDVCRQVGFSASYFSTLFRKETGQTFLEYLGEIRMEEAKRRFRQTKLPMEAICRDVGIHDYKRFAKNFKKSTGISPKEYRNLYS